MGRYWGGAWGLAALLSFGAKVAGAHAPNEVDLLALGLFFLALAVPFAGYWEPRP